MYACWNVIKETHTHIHTERAREIYIILGYMYFELWKEEVLRI